MDRDEKFLNESMTLERYTETQNLIIKKILNFLIERLEEYPTFVHILE